MEHFIRKTLITIGCILFFGALAAYAIMLLISAINWLILSVIFLAIIVLGVWIWYKGLKYHKTHHSNERQ